MLRLIQGKVLGMDMFIVLWEVNGEFRAKGFNSVEYARNYIMHNFKHLNAYSVEAEHARTDLSNLAWMLQTY